MDNIDEKTFASHIVDLVKNKKTTQPEIAGMLAWRIKNYGASGGSAKEISKAIIDRWSLSALERILTISWGIVCGCNKLKKSIRITR